MADLNESNDSLACFSDFDTPKFRALVGLRSGLSFVASCCLLLMIGFMILFKKHRFFTQRLILYLAISALAYDLNAGLNVTSLIAYKNKPALYYCYIVAFIEQVTIWWLIMAYLILVIDIFLKAVFNIFTERLEVLYGLLIFLSPLVYSWIPFIRLSFGPAGTFCWIRSKDLEDCSDFSFGSWLRFILYYIPLYIVLVILVVLMVITFCFIRRQRKKWAGKMEDKKIKKRMEKEIRPLLYYPFIVIIINIFALSRRLYELHSSDDTVYYILSILVTVTYRFQGIIITLVFILDPETRKKLNRQEILASCQRLCQKEDEVVKDYPMRTEHSDSHVGPSRATESPL